MNDTLLTEYISVISDIRDFRQFQHTVLSRCMRLYVANPINLIRDFRVIWDTGKDIDFLAGTTHKTIIQILEKYSSSNDRQSQWYPILVANRSTDALSIFIRTKYQYSDFSSLNKLHQAKGKVLSRNNPKAPMAFILAAATAIVKTTPKSIVEGMFGVPYSTFESSIFLWMIALSGFFLIFLAPAWLGVNNARGLFDYAAYMFDYLDLTALHENDGSIRTE